MNMHASAVFECISPHDAKKNFIRKNPSTLRYSDTHQQVQVSSPKPPVSAIASSRPASVVARRAPSFAGFSGSSGQFDSLKHKLLDKDRPSALSVVRPIQRSTIQRARPLDFVAGSFAKNSLESIRAPQQHDHRLNVVCPACRALEAEAMADYRELSFAETFPRWLQEQDHLSARTIEDYIQYANALGKYFGEMRLKSIGLAEVKGYQRWRSPRYASESKQPFVKYQHAASNVRIKNEINSVLKPILREIGNWAEIVKDKKFKHLPVPTEGSGIALTKEQWGQIFAIAFENKRWQVAGHCLQIMFRQGCGFGELRKVRRRDILLDEGRLRIVEGAKNEERQRTVTLVPSALESLKWLIARWERMGGNSPDQYLLPHKATIKNKALDRPMESINFAWNGIKHEWAVRQPKQARSETRQYDARVSAATLLLKNKNLSLATIEKALGWTPSSAMRKRYYRADQETILEALKTLEDVG